MGPSSKKAGEAATGKRRLLHDLAEAPLSNSDFERINVYPEGGLPPANSTVDLSGPWHPGDNRNFRFNFMTWLSLGILLLLYPGMSLAGLGQDYSELLKDMSSGFLIVILVVTVLFQWAIFLVNYASVYLEGTGLKGIGLKRIRLIDFAWAFAFMLTAWLVLSAISWMLGQVGLPSSGDVSWLIPKDSTGRIVWVFVSFTAGFCEEVGFRGYLLTRLQLLFGVKSWIIPAIISSLAFGACHVYQGLPGFILVSVYGLMFSALFVRTGRLWPGIIAHFFWDFGALFFPY